MKSEVYLASFDPGESTGWALLDKAGNLIKADTAIGREELYTVLEEIGAPPPVVVVEQFTLYQAKAIQQSGSKMETTRVIGVIESWARKSELVFQPANIKPIAEMWTGLKPKGSHKFSHHVDAINHGMYYLIKSGTIKRKRPGT